MEEATPGKNIVGSEDEQKVSCSMCQKEGIVGQFTMLRSNKGQAAYLCSECKEKTNQAFEDETKNPNISLAIAVGAVGAVVGGVIWYFLAVSTGKEIGYVSLGLGYLVGFGVYFGAGKKRGRQLQIISAILAIIAIIVTEKFIFDYFLNNYIQSHLSEFPNFSSGQSMSVSFFEPDFWRNLMSPIGLLIYAIGIYLAYNFCKSRKI